MKRFLSIILALMLLATMAAPVYADGIIGEIEMETEIRGLTEPNVRMLVSRYFAQRKAYLQGTADTISVVVDPMVTDETAHKEALVAAGATLVDSCITISSVEVGDYIADVVVIETATIYIDDRVIQEEIIHYVVVSMDYESVLCVNSDGYVENTTRFVSASYVEPISESEMNSLAGGSGLCIVSVAQSQIGYTEGADGYSKYGDWYGTITSTPSFAWDAWCVTFVVWCANQANISTNVIPLRGAAPYLADVFQLQGYYYRSAACGGSYVPKAGDIIFMFNTYDQPTHVGIVRYVTGNTVYFIDGNYYTTVEYKNRSLTSTDIVAYGSPDYDTTTHTYGSTWSYNASKHWKYCVNCAALMSSAHSIYIDDNGQSVCAVCGYIKQ